MNAQTRQRLAYGGLGVLFAAVGGPAFVASYRHAISVVERYGAESDQALAVWMPLTTDGMLVLVLIVMAVRRLAGTKVGWLPWTAFVAGMVATIAANLAAAPIDPTSWGNTIGALAVALWPPVTVMLTLELGAISLDAIRRWATPAEVSEAPVELLTQSQEFAEAPAVEPRTVADAVAEAPSPAAAPAGWSHEAAVAWAAREGAGAKRVMSHTGLSEYKAKKVAADAKAARALRVAR